MTTYGSPTSALILAFVRTGIYFITTALGIFHLDEKGGLDWLDWTFIVIGIASMIIGVINYFVIRRTIIRIYKLTN